MGTENDSAAVLNELRARLRWGWLLDDERLLRLSRPLRRGDRIDAARGATVAVRATLDALKGDFEHARPLFALAMEMRHSPRNVRCYCQAWLLADAAKRADYVEVLRLSWRGPRTLRRKFLRACAERLLLQELHTPALLGTPPAWQRRRHRGRETPPAADQRRRTSAPRPLEWRSTDPR